MSELTDDLINETIEYLSHLLSKDDNERVPAEHWVLDFRDNNPELYMFTLIKIIAMEDILSSAKAMAAVLLYSVFHKKTYDLQREFNTYWIHLDVNIRNDLCIGATKGIYSDDYQLLVQCSNILGAFYAIEFSSEVYNEQISALLQQTSSESDVNERFAAFSVFLSFTRVSLEFYPTCGKDQMFYQFSPILFQNTLEQMKDSSDPNLQHLAAKIFSENLPFFYRAVSFPQTFHALMETIFAYIADDNLFIDGFKVLYRVIDFFYRIIQNYFDDIVSILEANLQSENDERITQSCLILHLIGQVESDIEKENKSQVKLRHRDFDTNYGFSIFCFDHLLDTLLQLILTVDGGEIMQTSLPQLTAFICIADLAKSVDEVQEQRVVEFISANVNAEEWQLRFASVLMTLVALRIPSFNSQPQNILSALSTYIAMLNDTNPLVIDATMWCLGKCVQTFSDLAMNNERFDLVCQRLPEIVVMSNHLADRACWLLKQCIIAISNGEGVSVLGANFGVLSNFLCQITDTCPQASNHAFAALTQLIESTPTATAEECEAVLQKVVSQLHELIPENMASYRIPIEVADKMIWICTIIENITFLVGDMIIPIEDPLMQMLLKLMKADDIDVVRESLPAMGAIACSIKTEFSKYTDEILTVLPSLLSGEICIKTIRPASLLLGDMYTAGVVLPPETTAEFANLLIQTIESEEATPTTKSSVISVLGTIISVVGSDSLQWIDSLIPAIANELKSRIEEHEELNNDFEAIIALHLAALSAYKAMIPVLAQVTAGFKRVKSFFFIFEIIRKYTQNNPEIISAAIDLIQTIAEILGRQLHVILNSAVVITLLEHAIQEGTEETKEKASATLELITSS